MQPRTMPLLITLLATAVAGCSSDSTGPGGGSFTGNWHGVISENKGGGIYGPFLRMNLTETGTTVTGSYADSITTTYADSGTVAGTVANGTLTFTVTLNPAPPASRCGGTLSGTATISNGKLTGTYGGRDCDFLAGGADPNRTATFTLDP